ncbi:MFS transporter [Longispora fulva]|uniref:MFS family permease n=1 Tax=Longispora fulva TaxID=619741 RepID=A0A8J7GFG2_9ACTN|nr:MFS transporter [Longispora fulva]MBG6134933.1 MFS family permease [Longispora fulva]GIG56835.1 MFS transporter [Longispora fulva]
MATPLRYPKFRLLLAGRFTNTLGGAVAPVALAFAVLDLTGSVTDLGLVVGARSVANVLFLLFGGVLADRLPRSAILIGSSTLSALSQGAIAMLFLTGHATVPVLVALAAVNGTVSAFAYPASAAILPQTVPDGERQSANAFSRLATNGAMIVGAPLGGVLIAATSPGWGLVVDAASFLISGVLFALLRVPSVARGGTRDSILHDLRTGWREFSSRTWLWAVVLGFMFLNAAVVAAGTVLGPGIAKATIGAGGWGAVLGAQTFGMVLGALLAMRLRVRRLLRLGVVSVGALCLLPLALAFAPNLPALAAAGFLSGICVEQFSVAWETSMQQEVPPDLLARVYSYDMLGSFVAIPIGQMAAGPVSKLIGVGPTLVGCAAVVLLATAGMLVVRGVRTLEAARVTAEPVPVS